MSDQHKGNFPETMWTIFEQAANSGRDNPVLRGVVGGYREPVHKFLRAKGFSSDRADELTQSFLLKFWDKGWFDQADRSKGRFRNLLLTMLKRYLADNSDTRVNNQERFERKQGHWMDSPDGSLSPAADDDGPDHLFMVSWAKGVLRSAQEETKRKLAADGRSEWYDVFAASLESEGEGASQTSLALRFGLSRDQVRYAIEQTKTRLLASLREVASDQTAPNEDLDVEVREIIRLASR